MNWSHRFIFLGASKWPYLKGVDDSDAMRSTYKRLIEYVERVPDIDKGSQILDLFDSPKTVPEIDESITNFLKGSSGAYSKLVVFYIGHGHISKKREFRICIRNSRSAKTSLTTYEITNLAETIYEESVDASTLLVLDCCWAASAFKGLQIQSENEEALGIELEDSIAVPQRLRVPGMALLCASPTNRPAIAPENGGDEPTKFGAALISILTSGLEDRGADLTAGDLQKGTKRYIADKGDERVPFPEVHFPKGQGEGIDLVEFFPNLARFRGLSPLEEFALQVQLDSAKLKIEELKQEVHSLRRGTTRQGDTDRVTLTGHALKKGFFAPGFLTTIIGQTREALDIVVGRAKFLHYDTYTELNRLCRRGVVVRCFSLSENAGTETLDDAKQTVAPNPPKNGVVYKEQLNSLNSDLKIEVQNWSIEERQNAAFYTYRGVPRVNFVRSDNRIYYGFLTLFTETHEDLYNRPYLEVPIDSEIGRVLVHHLEVLIGKDITEHLAGDLKLK